MTQTNTVLLPTPAGEMAREEIRKQIAFLSRDICNIRFRDEGAVLEFDSTTAATPELTAQAENLCKRIQRSLRSLKRKVAYRSPRYTSPVFRSNAPFAGVSHLGRGQVALDGLPLALLDYFDRCFTEFGTTWNARPVKTPTLIPTSVLGRCGYFQSFPQNVTFACHLPEDAQHIESFQARHRERLDLDEKALHDMDRIDTCLSPAVCYHVYHLHEGQRIPAAVSAFEVCGKCFRYEANNLSDLRRLWDFTMRETVLLGGKDEVLTGRAQAIDQVARFLEKHELAGEICTASDPFFVASDQLAGTALFQLTSETKYEIALLLPDDERLAVGSLNYHTDYFGRAFHTDIDGGGAAHSVCIGFGLERWVHAFLCQHGTDPARYPEVVKEAIKPWL